MIFNFPERDRLPGPDRLRPVFIWAMACLAWMVMTGAALAAAPAGNNQVVGAAADASPAMAPIPGAPAGTTSAASCAVRFEGNRELSNTVLRSAAAAELRRFLQQGCRPMDADDAAFQMEAAYQEQGWAQAEVNFRLESEETETVLTFIVHEGPRVFLKNLAIAGNRAFPQSLLLKFFQFRHAGLFGWGDAIWDATRLRNGLGAVRDFYLGEGYLDVRLAAPQISFSGDNTRAGVIVGIDEGVRSVISSLVFSGDVAEAARAELRALAPEYVGQPAIPRRLLGLKSRILEIYGNLGYPDAAVENGTRAADQAGQVRVELNIRSGPQVKISRLAVTGNRKASRDFIAGMVKFKPDDLYHSDFKRQSFDALYATGLFDSIDLRLEPGPDPTARELRVAVHEAQSRTLYVEPGWGSYELGSLKAGYQEKNIFGSGRTAGLDAKLSFKGEEAEIRLTDPWFFGLGLTAEMPFYYRRGEEPAYTGQEIGYSLRFSKKIYEPLQTSLGINIKSTQLYEVDIAQAAGAAPAAYSVTSLKYDLTYDTRQNIFFPSAGQKNSLAAEWALPVLGSELSFVRLTVENRFYLSLTDSTILGLRYDSGLLLQIGQQLNIPVSERFYNGGENTVRSYYEGRLGPRDDLHHPLGGLAANTFSLEIRQKLFDNFVGTLFFDCGNVSPQQPPAQVEMLQNTLREFFDHFHAAAGIGLEYLLPVGPARLNLAVNPAPDPDLQEERYLVLFSVGSAF